MKQSEFLEKVLRPLYVAVSGKELISEKSANYNFDTVFKNLSLHDQVDILVTKVFMYDLKNEEVGKLREAINFDYTLGFDNYFEKE